MTLDQLVIQLQGLQAKGHGAAEVFAWLPGQYSRLVKAFDARGVILIEGAVMAREDVEAIGDARRS